MDYLLRRLLRVATRRGMRGDHWAWFAIAAGVYVIQRARRKEPPVVFSQTVKPGDRLLVSLRSSRDAPVEEPLPG